ncbi:hypothetical protein IQ266_18805 [filamentous cyanobacterium LEGE 11480]|uniref:Uncharacterized protein n=1 Tax=Romeriopsis navalis LEGE 11480 TaxID=2777977 RepID=A0A928Z5S5_9CYAN|nr:hypothetical protein [Romeriopsis navalis]MBE9031788.1 hypothetical protein [Romeriopsis navalis LEGE 11480]
MNQQTQDLLESIAETYPSDGYPATPGHRYSLAYDPLNGELTIAHRDDDRPIEPRAYTGWQHLFVVPPNVSREKLLDTLAMLQNELMAIVESHRDSFLDGSNRVTCEWDLSGIAWLYRSRFPLITQRLSS